MVLEADSAVADLRPGVPGPVAVAEVHVLLSQSALRADDQPACLNSSEDFVRCPDHGESGIGETGELTRRK